MFKDIEQTYKRKCLCRKWNKREIIEINDLGLMNEISLSYDEMISYEWNEVGKVNQGQSCTNW